MPPRHRRDMLGVAFAAALSSAYFVTLGLLLQPLPSHVLPPRMLIPDSTASRPLLVAASPAAPVDAPQTPTQARAPRRLKVVRSSVIADASAMGDSTSAAPHLDRRPRFFGRIFRGVLRTVQLAGPP